jgi:hypothetical protein
MKVSAKPSATAPRYSTAEIDACAAQVQQRVSSKSPDPKVPRRLKAW